MADEIVERRQTRRAKIAQQVQIRIPIGSYLPEVCLTRDMSRFGLYFVTQSPHYAVGLEVRIIRNFREMDPANMEEVGHVVRVEHFANGRFGVAIYVGALGERRLP